MLESFVSTYGYLAVLIGTFLEGETILMLGGFAAKQGYLSLPWVIAAAFAGSTCGDQFFFFLGRRHKEFMLTRRPYWKVQIDRAHRLFERYHALLILASRFLYGFRIVIPYVIGMSHVPVRYYVSLNLVGALVWAVLGGVLGYLFGNVLEILLGDVKEYEVLVMVSVIALWFLLWCSYLIYRRCKGNRPDGRA
ncbi:MAG: DedA family protein [Syntrophobacterales bacterium]|nr:DedA family protein [Syntrophobacterales bacterium]